MNRIALKKTNATLRGVTTRKENHGEDLVLATDLTIETVVPSSFLSELTDAQIPWEEFCWDTDENFSVRDTCVDHFALSVKFEAHGLRIFYEKAELSFEDVTLKKFEATPLAGRQIELRFQAQVHPKAAQYTVLGQALMNNCKVKIEQPRQQDMVEEINKADGKVVKINSGKNSEKPNDGPDRPAA